MFGFGKKKAEEVAVEEVQPEVPARSAISVPHLEDLNRPLLVSVGPLRNGKRDQFVFGTPDQYGYRRQFRTNGIYMDNRSHQRVMFIQLEVGKPMIIVWEPDTDRSYDQLSSWEVRSIEYF